MRAWLYYTYSMYVNTQCIFDLTTECCNKTHINIDFALENFLQKDNFNIEYVFSCKHDEPHCFLSFITTMYSQTIEIFQVRTLTMTLELRWNIRADNVSNRYAIYVHLAYQCAYITHLLHHILFTF